MKKLLTKLLYKILKKINADTGSISDGYHTFDELYYQRTVMFSVLCHEYKLFAWKSKLHADGTMYDGSFICGISTPEGQATYHFKMECWDMFDVRERDNAPVWDGYTPMEAIARILTLKSYKVKLVDEDED